MSTGDLKVSVKTLDKLKIEIELSLTSLEQTSQAGIAIKYLDPRDNQSQRELPVTLRNIERDQSRSHYKLDAFRTIPAAIQLVDSSVDVENLPGIERIIAKYPWDEQHFALFMGTVEEGQRSHALMRIGYFCAEKA